MKHFAFAALLSAVVAAPAMAADFSFNGTFAQDDDVQFFNFTVGAASTVTLRSYSYAGGVQADGTVVSAGGFDTELALFDSTGLLIDQNDDGAFVPTDANTGESFDTMLEAVLAAGNYTVSVMQYNNSATGPNLSDGFDRQGEGNFTPALAGDCAATAFCDVSGVPGFNERTNAWAFDVLNVDAAITPTVPIPAALPLMAGGLALLGFIRRKA